MPPYVYVWNASKCSLQSNTFRVISFSIQITFKKRGKYNYQKYWYLIHVLILERWLSTRNNNKKTQHRKMAFKVIIKAMKITSCQTRHVQHFEIPLCRPHRVVMSVYRFSFVITGPRRRGVGGGGVLPGVCVVYVDALSPCRRHSRKRLMWCVAEESGMGFGPPIEKEEEVGNWSVVDLVWLWLKAHLC